MVTWQWKRLPGYLQVVQMTHIVITQNDFSPVLSLKVAECGDKPGEHKQEDLCRTLRSAIEGWCAMWSMLCTMNVQYGLVMNEWSHLLVKWLPHVYMPSPTHTAPNPSRPLLHFFLFTGVFVTCSCCFFHLFTPIDCNCQTAVVSEGCSCAYMQISDLVAHALGLFLTTTTTLILSEWHTLTVSGIGGWVWNWCSSAWTFPGCQVTAVLPELCWNALLSCNYAVVLAESHSNLWWVGTCVHILQLSLKPCQSLRNRIHTNWIA